MELFSQILEALLDTVKDTVLILPFLFCAFLIIGLIERGAGAKMVGAILAADRIGPLAGGILGVVPSCGFSAAASNLFGAGLITVGTLISVYISTSDEMLAVMISHRADGLLILKILLIKAVCGILCGFIIDFSIRGFYALRKKRELQNTETDNEENGEYDEDFVSGVCDCNDSCCAAKGNLFVSSLKRTLRIFLFIFVISLLLNIVFLFIDPEIIGTFANKYPLLGSLFAAVFGLIPNCAVSVALTELYLEGVISASSLLCGLMTGAGSGLLVLFRTTPDKKEAVFTVCLLLISGLVFGNIAGAVLF